MKNSVSLLALLTAGLPAALAGDAAAQGAPKGLDNIETVVVIYAENRSFDNLYGSFPGANGMQNVAPANSRQLDRDGSRLKELPPIWGGLTGKGITPPVTEAQTGHLPNKPFGIDDPKGFNTRSASLRAISGTCFIRTKCRSTAARTIVSPLLPIPAGW
jgi:phospholipase C